jgi:putative heme-binding domain-containing protein
LANEIFRPGLSDMHDRARLILGAGCVAALIACRSHAAEPNSDSVIEAGDAAAWALVEAADGRLSRAQIADLLTFDADLQHRRDPRAIELQAALLTALGESGTTAGVEYVRGVFESEPERRDEAAYALSRFALRHRQIHGDWQYLVRSLLVVEGDRAQSVIAALNEFPERATKPSWIRQVILLGLTFEEAGARQALRLLRHWADKTAPDADERPADEQLAAWQQWFRESYPEEADPAWPVEPANVRWQFEELWPAIERFDVTRHDRKQGAEVFVRAGCSKCHRIGSLGEQVGPELTRIATRLQRKQILREILFPSLHLNEEYPTATILLRDGRVLSGTVTAAGPDAVLVGASDGAKAIVEKSEIDEVHPSRLSAMPAGLLDRLTLPEVESLIAFLLDPPPA